MVRVGDFCVMAFGDVPLAVYDVRKDPTESTNLVSGIAADAFPWPDRADDRAREKWIRKNLPNVK